jgi:pimeloyl-ACP methyl ester carboxylesterase
LKKEVFVFSGLGADKRVFQNNDFSPYSVTYINWIIPKNNDSIEEYASKLIQQIKSTKPTLIGLSFGGIMAVEVAKQIETEKVILLASAKSKFEIPFYFRLIGAFYLHRLLPTSLLKSVNIFTYWFFGAKSIFEKELLKQILIDTNPVFLKWAIDKIARWKNANSIKNLYHIHGTSDYILPLSFVKADCVIQGGGHLMTLNKAKEIDSVLLELI